MTESSSKIKPLNINVANNNNPNNNNNPESKNEKPLTLNRQNTNNSNNNNNININSANNLLLMKNTLSAETQIQNMKDEENFKKAKTMGPSQRCDRFGNPIGNSGGQYHVTFLDRVSKNNFVEVIKVDNFKEYNKMEETSHKEGAGVGCCLII